MGCSPLRKSAERVFIFEDQVVGGRQDLFPGVREAFFEVGGYSELFTDGIEQIGCPLKRAGSVYYGDWPPLFTRLGSLISFQFSFLRLILFYLFHSPKILIP